jgi:hypothetical protein
MTGRKSSARNRVCKKGGSGSTDLSSILPKGSFYPLNTTILPNSVDTRATVPQPYVQRGGKRRNHRNKSKSKSKSKEKKMGYVNYAGRQIGCLSRSQRQRHSQKQRQRRSQRQKRARAQSQSGGDALSYLPQDVNMAARSATTFVSNLWADLQGTHHTVSPLPFSDQAIQSTSGKPTSQ